jgi:hypothetical protein
VRALSLHSCSGKETLLSIPSVGVSNECATVEKYMAVLCGIVRQSTRAPAARDRIGLNSGRFPNCAAYMGSEQCQAPGTTTRKYGGISCMCLSTVILFVTTTAKFPGFMTIIEALLHSVGIFCWAWEGCCCQRLRERQLYGIRCAWCIDWCRFYTIIGSWRKHNSLPATWPCANSLDL